MHIIANCIMFALAAGWGSSLKVLETQKQLQAKKCVLQNVKVIDCDEYSPFVGFPSSTCLLVFILV